MINLKRMSDCSFETAVDVWNRGFHGYVVDLTLNLEQLLSRIYADEISVDRSFIAFKEDKPVGFVMNAFRKIDGRRLAWNGGTGVVSELRGQGVGRVLMDAALDLYQTEKVDLALLEAISDNHPAIALYKKCGYEIKDELTLLQTDVATLNFEMSGKFSVERVNVPEVSSLPFYRELEPWQCQWQSLLRAQGEACVVYDNRDQPVGYALFQKKLDPKGKLLSIALYQCEVVPGQVDAADIAAHALKRVFVDSPGNFRRSTHDFRKSNEVVIELLTKAGFTTFIEQVHMIKTFG